MAKTMQETRACYGLRVSRVPLKCVPEMLGYTDEHLNDVFGGDGYQEINPDEPPAPSDPVKLLAWEEARKAWLTSRRKKIFGCVRSVVDTLLEWYPNASIGIETDPHGTVPPYRIWIVHYGPSKKRKQENLDLDPMVATA